MEKPHPLFMFTFNCFKRLFALIVVLLNAMHSLVKDCYRINMLRILGSYISYYKKVAVCIVMLFMSTSAFSKQYVYNVSSKENLIQVIKTINNIDNAENDECYIYITVDIEIDEKSPQ